MSELIATDPKEREKQEQARALLVEPPPYHPRKRFIAKDRPAQGEETQWARTIVTVYDTMHPDFTDEPTEDIPGKPVFTYHRNYSMMSTFEPFRQLHNGVWHNYALISTQYTRFEVADLDEGEIIAVQPYPIRTQEDIDRIGAEKAEQWGWKANEEIPGAGFCPVAFRVIDWTEEFSPGSINEKFDLKKPGDDREFYLYGADQFARLTGQWGIYSGCVWGDDSSMKLRYIDLSRIREGIVTADDRFGYFPLGCKLDEIGFSDESGQLELSLQTWASIDSGKVTLDGEPNWEKDPDA